MIQKSEFQGDRKLLCEEDRVYQWVFLFLSQACHLWLQLAAFSLQHWSWCCTCYNGLVHLTLVVELAWLTILSFHISFLSWPEPQTYSVVELSSWRNRILIFFFPPCYRIFCLSFISSIICQLINTVKKDSICSDIYQNFDVKIDQEQVVTRSET